MKKIARILLFLMITIIFACTIWIIAFPIALLGAFYDYATKDDACWEALKHNFDVCYRDFNPYKIVYQNN